MLQALPRCIAARKDGFLYFTSAEAYSNYSWTTHRRASRTVPAVLGDEIRKARIMAGITQEELAFRAKLSRNYISLLELNQKSPTFDSLTSICQAMGIRVSVLVARSEHETPTQKPRRSR